MRPENIQLSRTQSIVDRNRSTGVETVTNANVRFKNIQVSSSGIVAGDFVKPNYWLYDVVRQDMLEGRLRHDGAVSTRIIEGLLSSSQFGGGVYRTPFDANLHDRLYNEALSKLNDKFRGGVDISEDVSDRRNVNRIARSGESLCELAGSVNRSARGKVSVMSKLWLSKQYTWQPLVNNIYESAVNILEREERIVRASASAYSVLDDVDSTFVVRTNPTAHVPIRYRVNGLMRVKLSVTLKSNKLLLGNFTSFDPMVLIWNQLPYSFIVDWFFGVGEWLRNKETTTRFAKAFVGGYRSWLLAENVVGEIAYSGKHQGYPLMVSGRSGAHNISFRRTVLTGYPSPRMPMLNMDLSLSRIFSLCALLGARLGVRDPSIIRRNFL